jgi:hypothetical protein
VHAARRGAVHLLSAKAARHSRQLPLPPSRCSEPPSELGCLPACMRVR